MSTVAAISAGLQSLSAWSMVIIRQSISPRSAGIPFFGRSGSMATALARTTRYLPELADVNLSCGFSVPVGDGTVYGCDVKGMRSK